MARRAIVGPRELCCAGDAIGGRIPAPVWLREQACVAVAMPLKFPLAAPTQSGQQDVRVRPSPGSRPMYENNQDAVPTLQQLTFSLAGEEYGVDILSVREIRGWSRVTRIPQTPAHLLGVLNLRGAIVPIMDLRLRFGLERESYGDNTVVIILAITERLFGIVVDAVSDVVDIDPAAIKPVPDMGAIVDTRYLKGLIAAGDRMVLLLDVERLLKPQDKQMLEAALAETQAAA
jgi:purine-binding chemotaxis protein CheW